MPLKRQKGKENYLKAAHNLLVDFPEILENYVCKQYPGGVMSAIQEKEDELFDILSEDQKKIVEELFDSSQHAYSQVYENIVDRAFLDGEVLDRLISACLMTTDDRKQVESHARQFDRNKAVLDILTERSINPFYILTEALKNSRENDSKFIESLELKVVELTSKRQLSIDIEEYTVKLQKNYYNLVTNLSEISTLSDRLIQCEILTPDDSSEIHSTPVRSKQVRKMLEKIKSKNAYDEFMKALKEDDVTAVIAYEIEKTVVTEKDLQLFKAASRSQGVGIKLGIDVMILLVSVVAEVSIPIVEPEIDNFKLEADLYRLQMTLNQIIKDDKLDDNSFYNITECLTKIAERITKSSFKPEFTQNKHFVASKKLESLLRHFKSINKRDDIPTNIREQCIEEVEIWEKNDKKTFVETRASQYVLRSVLHNSCVTVTASSGVGKSAIVRHTALILQKKGYDIIPIKTPGHIKEYYRPGRRTIFVIDDMCGNYTASQQTIERWREMLDTVKLIIDDKYCKIIVACRLHVYKDIAFDILRPFKSFECNLMSDQLCLSAIEMNNIASSYIAKEILDQNEISQEMECFPLLCSSFNVKENGDITRFFQNPFEVYKNELDNLFNTCPGDKGKLKIAALALCVIYNNKLPKKILQSICQDKLIISMFEDVCKSSKLNKGTPEGLVQDAAESLLGTYINLTEGVYHTIHDKMFDLLSSYFGEKMTECVILHADSSFIRERFARNHSTTEFIIKLNDDEHLNMYFKRLISDWENGIVTDVFYNNNFKETSFRKQFLEYISDLQNLNFDNLVNMTESIPKENQHVNTTPLICCCNRGYMDMVQWLIDRQVDVNYNRDDGITGLYMCCQNGHLKVVNKLSAMKADANKCDNDGRSPLYAACIDGHLEVVGKLLEMKADVNKCDNEGCSPLWTASLYGHLKIVNKLLEMKADVSKCRNNGASPLLVACENGHLEVVNKLLEMYADVNMCDNNGASPLHVACQNEHLVVVNKLLEIKADANQCDDKGSSPLWIASLNGHLKVVNKLLEMEADINKCDNDGRSPLYAASIGGNLEVVSKLLEMKADVNQSKTNGVSPLWIACQKGHLKVVNKLLEMKADVNKCDNVGCSPLWIASLNGHLEIVNKLLEMKADINKCRNNGASPVYVACANGHLEVVNKLLEVEPDVNQSKTNGVSPLWIACQNGHLEVVNKLLQFNANVNYCNDEGVSPFWIACQEGHLEVVNKLSEMKADVHKSDNEDRSPLWAANLNGHLNIVCKLLEMKSDFNKCTTHGMSPLYIASFNGHLKVVNKLLEMKAGVNKCDNDGRSPLYAACQKGHLKVVNELLEMTADVNKCDNNGASPLYVACQNEHLEVVNKLLEIKADVNMCDNNGASPLYVACQNEHLEVVCELLDKRADVNLCDNKMKSPLYVASQNGYLEVVSKLLDGNADVNKCYNDGTSPLYAACQKGYFKIVDKLLKNQAQVNRCDRECRSPLWVACSASQMNICKKLLEFGGDTTTCDNEGKSPLYLTCENGSLNMLCTLLDINADVNQCKNNGISPLHIACINGHVTVVDKLIENKADINQSMANGMTAVRLALQNGHLELFDKLLTVYAEVNNCTSSEVLSMFLAGEI